MAGERNEKLEKDMEGARTVSSYLLSGRKSSNIKVRIPLKKLHYSGPSKLGDQILEVIKGEVNVYELQFLDKQNDWSAGGHYDPSNQDLKAGEARDIIRKIQEERKKLGTTMDELIQVTLPDWPKDFEEDIKKKALIKQLTKGDTFTVSRI
jgi:Cu/Ag efflux protein CusF